MSDRLTFCFDGEPVTARPGQSLAAALADAGESVFRHTDRGAPRGLFCGMGVCQDCLLTVDGTPNQRACMTPVTAGADVRRQSARAPLTEATPNESEPRPRSARALTPDVLIVGAGAGGLHAAVSAAGAGAEVLVLDERRIPGGQYHKQPAANQPLLDAQQSEGARLLAAARDSGARIIGGVEIWGAFAGPLLYATDADGAAMSLRPRQLIVATGAYERPLMVPGWTLPGVMTTGAAQTLWRSYRSLPGKRIALCGSGPLNLQVALELARAGAEVRLVAESAPPPLRRPLSALAMLAAGPRLALAGMAMYLGLRRAGVPVRHRAELMSVTANADGSLCARFISGGREERVDIDALCMNDGFEPQNEILRLLGAAMRFDDRFGQLRCVRDECMLTTVPAVYAVGDCAGLGGAPAAAAEGRIAGAAAAAACGHPVTVDLRGARRRLSRSRRFQKHLWELHDAAPRSLDDRADDTILCRCEEVSLGQFRAAMTAGTSHIGQIKNLTRLGMGCCQGRYCGPAAARLLSQSSGRPLEDHSFFAPRVPIKPVGVGALLAAREGLHGRE